jgi:hypothetical protein
MIAQPHPPLHEALDACECGAQARKYATMARHHLDEALRIIRHARLVADNCVTPLRPEFTQQTAELHLREHMIWRTGFRMLVNANRHAVGFMDGYGGAAS